MQIHMTSITPVTDIDNSVTGFGLSARAFACVSATNPNRHNIINNGLWRFYLEENELHLAVAFHVYFNMNRLRPALTLSSCVTYFKLKPAALWLILTLGVPSMENPIGLEQLSPLADAAIGGLLVGIFMSLFYLPMFYVWASGKIK